MFLSFPVLPQNAIMSLLFDTQCCIKMIGHKSADICLVLQREPCLGLKAGGEAREC